MNLETASCTHANLRLSHLLGNNMQMFELMSSYMNGRLALPAHEFVLSTCGREEAHSEDLCGL